MIHGWISRDVSREAIEGFLSFYGRTFYDIAPAKHEAIAKRSIRLERKGEKIPQSIQSRDGSLEVVPFRRGEQAMTLTWFS